MFRKYLPFAASILLALLVFGGMGLAPSSASVGTSKVASEAVTIETSNTRLTNNMRTTENGTPLVMTDVNYKVDSAAPEEMALQYIRENAVFLGLPSSRSAESVVNHKFTLDSHSGASVRYEQVYRGIPVYKSEIVVHVNNKDTVSFVTNDFKSDVSLASITPALSAEEARNIAADNLRIQNGPDVEKNKLMVLKTPDGAKLVYVVNMVVESPAGDWETVVDANSGDIMWVRDTYLFNETISAIQRVDGNGNIFDPDPLSTAGATYGQAGFSDSNDSNTPQLEAQMVNVTLRDIEQSGSTFTLRGPWAEVQDFEGPFKGLFQQNSSTFNFNRSDDAFEAVNTYYHIDDSMRYINDTLGINLRPFQYSTGVRFDPSGWNGFDNSSYSPTAGRLSFGEGGVDDAEDSDVIHHELGHGLHDWLTNGNLSQVNGLSEGLGDYWAQSYNRATNTPDPSSPAWNFVFRWDGHNSFWGGRSTAYTASYPGGLTGSIHTDGQIWATCNINILDEIGREKMDTAFLEGIGMTGGNSSQNDAANAVFQAAQDMSYSNSDLQIMHDTYTSCGYTLPPFVAAGLEVTKSAAESSVIAGNTLEYTISVENTSGNAASNVEITDELPDELTYVNGSSSCGGSVIAGILTMPLGNLNSSSIGSCSFTVSVDVNAAASSNLFEDDMESGLAQWNSAGTSSTWATSTANPHAGNNSAFANNGGSISDQYLEMASAVNLVADATLEFWHSYNTGADDGGMLEISVDGGAWQDLGANITSNGYDATVSTPLGNRDMFTGNSGGYVKTEVDLSAFTGDDVQIRFRFFTSASGGADGWHVDDVAISVDVGTVSNTACAESAQGDSDCDTAVVTVEPGTATAVGLVSAETQTPSAIVFAIFVTLILLIGGSIAVINGRAGRQTA